MEKHKHALQLNPDFRKAHRDLALTYAEMGKPGEALDELDRAKGLTQDDRDLTSVRAYVLARSGQAEPARQLLAALEPLAEKKPLAYEIATIYAALRDADRAMAWLQRAFAEHSAGRAGIAVDPRLANLHPCPQFKSLLNCAGLSSQDDREHDQQR